ncbi:hypothetical protein GCK32_022592, partial [Trichostrongylus colubriformis]
ALVVQFVPPVVPFMMPLVPLADPWQQVVAKF